MDPEILRPYLIPAALAAYAVWRFFEFRAVRARVPKLLRRGAVIVDVRSPVEFAEASRPGSVNIPLGALPARARELDPVKPVIVCCASGSRSARAAALLQRRGFRRVLDAGPWSNTLCA